MRKQHNQLRNSFVKYNFSRQLQTVEGQHELLNRTKNVFYVSMLLRVTVTLDTFKESFEPFAPGLETVFSAGR